MFNNNRPHLLPARTIATAHLASLLASQQSQLNAKLQTTQSQNAALADGVKSQREEIERLLAELERVVRDLDSAAQLLNAEAESLAKGSRAAEGVLREV